MVVMSQPVPTPLIRLSNLFPGREVFAKCEFVAPSGSFKIRGAQHLLARLRQEGRGRQLVVPSMGNTALGAAVGARMVGFSVTGVVPETIGRAKEEKLRDLNVELIKIAGGGTDLLRRATEIAQERGAYFVHPHLDPLWTDGYQGLADEILQALPGCRTVVFPVGGGGLLMGLTKYFARHPAPVKLVGCEAYNFPTYARYGHQRSATIADGLILETPHAQVQERIAARGVAIELVKDAAIRSAMKDLVTQHALLVEPSSAITTAWVQGHLQALQEPVCVILTGENIGRDEFFRLIAVEDPASPPAS
jgi:threonine dehydratase